MKKCYLFILFICIAGISNKLFSQQNCLTALPVCSNANSGGVVNGFGYDDFFGSTQSGCLRNGLGVNTIETNSFWFRVKLAESGQFGFNIKPNNLSEDWDFAIYGPNPICGALGDPIACNYSKVSATGYTGVGIDPISNTKTIAYDDWMNVNAGEEYVVMVNQYSGSNAGFAIEWKGAVIQNNTTPLDCSILVNLGPDRELCDGENTILNATTFGPAISYKWFLKNESSGLFEQMPGLTTSAIYLTTSGNYKVEVTDSNVVPAKVLEDDIVITFHPNPTATKPNNMVLCDINNDGLEGFNLESLNAEILNGQTGLKVTYHMSLIDASVGANAQASPFVSSGLSLWARVENTTTKCYATTTFSVLAVPSIVPIKPPNLLLCDDNNDGEMLFDLESQTPIILNGQVGIVTYYDDETNAQDRKGWIVNTTAYLSETKTIWVRVEPSAGSDCYEIISFDLNVLPSPVANVPTNIRVCDTNNDGFYQFDLNALKDAEVLKAQNPADFELFYYSTQANADDNVNQLAIPYTNKTPYAEERIFVRIQNKSFSNCYRTTSFTLQVFDMAFPASSDKIPDLSYCDDLFDGNDTNGFYEFNLNERKTAILNGQSGLVFNVEYFEDPSFSATSKINNPQKFTNSKINGQTIYVRVSNSNTNNIDCFADTSFNIEVRPLPKALLTSFDFFQCDIDGSADGIADFNLALADSYVSLGNTSLNVSYYITPIEAASKTNSLAKFPFSNATSTIVYARVEAINGCYRIVQVNLNVSSSAFPPNYKYEMESCDDDATNDGLHVFNLALATSEIITLFPGNNSKLSFYRNQSDAISNLNEITPSNFYLSEVPYSQTIWVRVESSVNGGCFGIAPAIQLTVYPRPEFELDETAFVCLNEVPSIVSIKNPDGNYNYEWTDELGTVVSINPIAEIYNGGLYSVKATSILGCESVSKDIIISESTIATFSSEDLIISDNSKNNTITVNTANLGIGEYEFALDDVNGIYQDNPTFSRVLPGIHTVFVRDKNECGIAAATAYVLGFPNFFTPNNDGFNDYWNVRGVDTSLFKESIIYIYDRYGKMLTSFNANQKGWNGFYNNYPVISSDYWYLAKMVDVNGLEREFQGHFSLIRR